ncbi:protein Mut11-like [Patiria miniata]|uniref:Uncharacterized protein n=1 Tax=Patiria miniata TaxID=46514 RepID=A0A913ZRR8_PATMI|nr:protein Mut11-like [Patiria miniata]
MSGPRLALALLSFDGDTIASIDRVPEYGEDVDRDVRVWSDANGACRCILQSGNEATRLIHLDYKDKIVAAAYSDNTIHIWDTHNGSCMQEIVTDMNKLTSCHLGDGIIIGASKDLIVKIWEPESGKCIKTFHIPPHQGFKFGEKVTYTFSDGLIIVVTSSDALYVVNMKGERVLDVRQDVKPICFTGNKLLTYDVRQGNMMLLPYVRHGRKVLPYVRHGRKVLTYVRHGHQRGYELSIIDPVECVGGKVQGSSKTVSQYIGPTNLMRAWMSDTKLAFQRIGSESEDFETDDEYVSVFYYW